MSTTQQHLLPSEQQMRAAIKARDPAFDTLFVYGVITTGVFCLPSCAARPARPENLRFHYTTEAALAAGFRPCKRCQPLAACVEQQSLIELASDLSTCLLYTSPSPRDRTRSRMPSSA